MKIQVNAEVNIPEVPETLRLANGGSLSIAVISDDVLQAVGREWTIKLIQKATAKRSKP